MPLPGTKFTFSKALEVSCWNHIRACIFYQFVFWCSLCISSLFFLFQATARMTCASAGKMGVCVCACLLICSFIWIVCIPDLGQNWTSGNVSLRIPSKYTKPQPPRKNSVLILLSDTHNHYMHIQVHQHRYVCALVSEGMQISILKYLLLFCSTKPEHFCDQCCTFTSSLE